MILKKRVNKETRKAVGAACLMLAAKFWEPTITSESKLDTLIQLVVEEFDVPKKKFFALEFMVFVDMEFSLLLPMEHVYPHFVRLLAEYFNLTPQEYATTTTCTPHETR
eukprot:NODE_1601_length_1117_cov_52.294944_g1306_i0.p3 GENE.NODE_1601_length_1117_cov_52.294944_g1306_i0~~NODE_1601_length_1117_cov_52.294944_g1306_i0.p3  ORF type:complete len:109 (-),score=34.19 NODE_1601_length_1117_cov_52.294944_g1306_i0:113-439(-)